MTPPPVHFPPAERVLRTGYQVGTIARANEWWGYKMAPLLATAYATAGLLNQSLWPLLPQLLLLLLSLVVGAIYVSVLNDWTDRFDDQAARKTNRLTSKPARLVKGSLILCLLTGGGFGTYFWQLTPLSGLLYVGSWVAYSLYSLPPVRFKIRGLAGVLADALGAHLFPHLLATSLVACWSEQRLPLLWWLAVGGWSLACGVRNILKHQLADADADQTAKVQTLVNRWGRHRSYRFGVQVAFPIEILAFGCILLQLNQLTPLLALCFYWGLELLRARFWRIYPVILAPDQRILFDEYYSIFLPLTLLLTQCLRYPADGTILVLHGALFGRYAFGTIREIKRLLTITIHVVFRPFN